MEDISNVSSEEELLQLRNEGKISEEEYEELRSAMRKSTKLDVEPATVGTNEAKSKRKLGKIAFTLMLVGIIVPVVAYVITGMVVQAKNAELAAMNESGGGVSVVASPGLWYLFGIILEISAFTMGVIAWPEVLAKATVIAISLISFIVLLALLLEIMFLGGF